MEGGDEDDGEVAARKAKPKGIAEIIGLETNNANSKKNTLSKADAASGNFQKAACPRREGD